MSSHLYEQSAGGAGPVDAAEFRHACGVFATGITVATVMGRDGKPHGLTANSFCSVSLHPPMVLVCVAHKASTHGPFAAASSFAINILSENQRELSVRFASSHSNRFEGVNWRKGECGAPVLDDSLAVLECATRERIAAGDHTIFLGEVRQATVKDGRPLVYFGGGYGELK